ncbi:MAG: phosphatase PAP2 family protein [Formivibrio sp.]|nr:phosphatase PAP2 family protein [Formivibrio sp.]
MNQTPAVVRKTLWKTYALWFCLNNLAFVLTYPLCNWITSWRSDTVGLYLPAELDIPFVPQLVWAYFSVNLLFIWPPFFLDEAQLKALGKRMLVGTLLASVVFLVIPTHLGFQRTIPADPLYRTLFSGLFFADQPHNLVPSLHVVYSALTVFTYVSVMSRLRWKMLWIAWLLLIMASTVLVHQHHLLDAFSGLLVAAGIHYGFERRQIAEIASA